MMQEPAIRREQPWHAEGIAYAQWLRSGTRLHVLTPADGAAPGNTDTLRDGILAALADSGAVLLRGFGEWRQGRFREFAAGFGRPLVSYEFASTPRRPLGQDVYSSTEYPAHQWIDQHNEQSYTLKWPCWIWFHCEQAASQGGATPIADGREVYRRLDPLVRENFRRKRVLYVRNYGNGLDLPWEDVFGSTRREDVEAYCAANHISCQWLPDGSLRTRQVCQSELIHPVTGDAVWFNQAHLFHVSNLAPHVREALLDALDGDLAALPRHAFYGDGSDIEDDVLDHIRTVYRACTLTFQWQVGDVLMLDNQWVSHGREPFQGARRILVAMAEAPAARCSEKRKETSRTHE